MKKAIYRYSAKANGMKARKHIITIDGSTKIEEGTTIPTIRAYIEFENKNWLHQEDCRKRVEKEIQEMEAIEGDIVLLTLWTSSSSTGTIIIPSEELEKYKNMKTSELIKLFIK